MARISGVCNAVIAAVAAVDIASHKSAYPVISLKEAASGDLLEPGAAHKHLTFIVEPQASTVINRSKAGAECSTPINVFVRYELAAGLLSSAKPASIRLARDLGEDIATALIALDGSGWTLTLDDLTTSGPDAAGTSILITIALTCIHDLGG